MLRAMLDRWLDKFERAWRYDASYLRDVARASPAGLVKFMLGTRAMDRTAAPQEVLFAVSLAGVLSEDCGPCTQITVDMALAQGLDPKVVGAVLAGDETQMGETAALAWRFARASLTRDMVAADPLREEIVRRWGETALVAIGLSLAAARMYPTLKYALGHGRSCSKVVIGGSPSAIADRPIAA